MHMLMRAKNPAARETRPCFLGFQSKRQWHALGKTIVAYAATVTAVSMTACTGSAQLAASSTPDPAVIAQGKQIFRFDTFGDESQWTDKLRMHEVIRTRVDPTTALSVGLKVDSEALPAAVVRGIEDGSIDLKSPTRPLPC